MKLNIAVMAVGGVVVLAIWMYSVLSYVPCVCVHDTPFDMALMVGQLLAGIAIFVAMLWWPKEEAA